MLKTEIRNSFPLCESQIPSFLLETARVANCDQKANDGMYLTQVYPLN